MTVKRGSIARITTGVVFAVAVLVGATGSIVSGHDEIASSDPASGSILEQPISEVTIDFGVEVDEVFLTLLDPDQVVIESVTEKVSPTVAKIDFAMIDRKGEYLVQYVAKVTEDGDQMIGAIEFRYGARGPAVGTLGWSLFGLVAAAIMAVGVMVAVRNSRRVDESAPPRSATA